MPRRTRAEGAALLASVIASTACADFIGLVCEPYVGDGWTENGYAALTTYRLYAEFDDPNDGVLSVFGLAGAPMSLRSSGGSFHNDAAHDSMVFPLDLRPDTWSNQWDTYVTLGTDPGFSDMIGLSPGFESLTDGLSTDWVVEDAGWFAFPCDGVCCHFEACNPAYRVVLAQFTVAEGEGVAGTVSLLFTDASEVGTLRFSSGFFCAEDVDESGDVGMSDLLAVLVAWGTCSACREDIDGDGTVGLQDVLAVLARWGPCG